MNKQLLMRPIISEKSFNLANGGTYTFLVGKAADKKQIEKEVEQLFKVEVVSVNIINTPGKVKKAGKKFGQRSDTKKALVRIKSGQKISIFETEESDKKEKDKKTVTDVEVKNNAKE